MNIFIQYSKVAKIVKLPTKILDLYFIAKFMLNYQFLQHWMTLWNSIVCFKFLRSASSNTLENLEKNGQQNQTQVMPDKMLEYFAKIEKCHR